MARTRFSIGTFNLFNLNEPGLPIYTDKDGWSKAEYAAKIAWTGRLLGTLKADVWGFQELWHAKSLKESFKEAKLLSKYRLLVPKNLAHLRLALIDHHREAFEEASALSFDPTNWMARALAADLTALIRTMELYEQAARLAEELEDVEF